MRRALLLLAVLGVTSCAPASSSKAAVIPLPAAPANVVMAALPIAAVAADVPASVDVPRDRTEFLEFETEDGNVRSARVRVPGSVFATPVPLVIALHGSNSSGAALETLSGYDDVADREGFVVAYADGLGVDNGNGTVERSWNSGGCCEPATSVGVDDVAFVTQLIDRLIDQYPIDPSRVFVVGHSNGAIMAQMLGCRIADRLAGIASVAGALDDSQSCWPSRPVPFLELHGTADQHVAWDAGSSSVSLWRRFDNCADRSDQTRAEGVTTSSWSECADGATVSFVSIDNAEHPWPGQRVPSVDGETVSFAVDAAETTWTFFSSVSPVRTASNLG